LRQTAFIVLLLLAVGAAAQTSKTAPKQPPAAKKQSASPAKKSAAAPKQPPASKSTAAKKSTSKSGTRKRVVARKRIQQRPTPERYTEIQQALIGKGYFQGPADGVWGPDSVAALKRFQEDQKLEATGKIDALSLIRLGLGPKREAVPQNGGLPPSGPKEGP
jgi:peptidoglycan hydrolase-like protein with peptidoglycan-binding domain